MSDQEDWVDLDEYIPDGAADLYRGRYGGEWKYYKHLISGLKRLQEENQFCDISIKVGYRTFNAHKVVLASSCEYFQRMFSSGFQEAAKAEITMEGNSMIFAMLHEFIYTGNMKGLSQTNAVGVFEMACYIQFDHAVNMCRKYFMKQFKLRSYHYHNREIPWIPLQTAYEVIRLAENYKGQSDLVNKGKEYIKREFLQLAKMEDFCENTTAECLEVCLGDIERNTKEEDLVSLVRRWLKHSWDSRKQNAPCLLRKLRLGLLTDDSLTALLDEMQDVQECKEILDEVRKLKDPLECDFTGGTMEYLYPHYFAPRSTITALVTFGGKRGRNEYFKQEDSNSSGYWKPFRQIPQLPQKRRLHSSVVVRGQIYVAGGLEQKVHEPGDETKRRYRQRELLYGFSLLPPQRTWEPTRESFWKYDGRNNDWQELPLLQLPRYSFALVHMENCLFFIGGKGEGNRVLQEVDCYHLSNQNWQSIGALPEPILNPSAVVFGGIILVYGQSVTSNCTYILQIYRSDCPGTSTIEGVWQIVFNETLADIPSQNSLVKPFLTVQNGKCYRVAQVERKLETSNVVSAPRWQSKRNSLQVKVNQLQVETEKSVLRVNIGPDEKQHSMVSPDISDKSFFIGSDLYITEGGCAIKVDQIKDGSKPKYYRYTNRHCEDDDGASVCLYTFDELGKERTSTTSGVVHPVPAYTGLNFYSYSHHPRGNYLYDSDDDYIGFFYSDGRGEEDFW